MMKRTDQIRQNLFPAAHESIWRAFPWHGGAHQPHSSQALAIDVFGTVQSHPLCDALVSELVTAVFGAQMSDVSQQGWTGKGVKYWRWIPRYFMLDNVQSYDPCPS